MGCIVSFFAIVWESLDLYFVLNQSFISIKNLVGSDDELAFPVKIDNDNFEVHRTLHHNDIFHENVDFIITCRHKLSQ